MWIMTKYGFISAVALDQRNRPSDRPDDDLQVRARDAKTLRKIRDRWLPEGTASEILALPNRDYQFRIYTTRLAFSAALSKAALEITYPNFKDTVRGKLHDLCTEMWWVIYQHYRRLPRDQRSRSAKGC